VNILANDYVEITLPGQFTIIGTILACTKLSENLDSISCSITNSGDRVIKIGTTINTEKYALDKSLQFTIGDVQMPSSGSATDNFIVK